MNNDISSQRRARRLSYEKLKFWTKVPKLYRPFYGKYKRIDECWALFGNVK